MKPNKYLSDNSARLAASITWKASKQTYSTIRFLVDRTRVADAYRTYGYFRWVDDQLDQVQGDQSQRLAFIDRQKTLVDRFYRGQQVSNLQPEECMLADLVASDRDIKSGLHTYIDNMMRVMDFDANRRGQLITQNQLNQYTTWLATGVSEAMHYFIGHGCRTPQIETRYHAVIGAHIVHLLRDTIEDTVSGYINIPREVLEANGMSPEDVQSPSYRAWVHGRVKLAQDCFKAGKAYMAQIENPRCRLAGYAYITRFTLVLDAIEKDRYILRDKYPEVKRLKAGLLLYWNVLSLSLNQPHIEFTRSARSHVLK